ncbi:hypothetical protein ASD16_18045 [Cellulomonas sp. Root485]|uniref:hypothetical protein n=1 Tax=Cellulomonas sp. Root485 TaxID=1736546 RepID=UPI000701144E|nr:hypothetical protein [Cellulomonas sp. Root485]KQY21223.1 hypothetical protein ASD16_18045 [Cellulomonas sp. Root485]
MFQAQTDNHIETTAGPPKVPPDTARPPTPVGAEASSTLTFLGRASWQAQPEVRRRELLLQIQALKEIPDEVVAMLVRDLDYVYELLLGRLDEVGRSHLHGLREWFTGARIGAVWQTLHGVERALVMYRSSKDLKGRLDGVVADAKQYLPKNDPAVAQAVRWSRNAPKDIDQFRSGVRDLLERSHQASDGLHESARRLRNGMLGITILTALSIVVLLVAQVLLASVWLIPAPEGFTAQPWVLLAFVMVAGSLGAFITAFPTTIRAQSGGLPYRLPIQQGLLKLVIGPLLAVVGVMFVAGGLVAAMDAETLPQLLALAVIFGSAQQALTVFADKSAGDLLATKSAT